MKKLIVMSLFAISSAGLYADYDQRNLRQELRGMRQAGQAGCINQQQQGSRPGYFSQSRNFGQSSMPYTTIVNEDAQSGGARQQYYYYGADSKNQRDEDYDNDDEDNNDNSYYNRGSNTTINREELRRNIQERAGNINREELRGNLQDRANNLRGALQDRAQNTYFNRNAQTATGATSDTFNSDSDRALGQRIRDAIKGGWFSKGYEQVSLDVSNGIVTLRGFVVSLDDKKKVEDAVKDVNGVSNVKNQLAVQAKQDNASSMRSANQANQTTSDDDDDDEDYDDDDNDYPQDRAATDADRRINNKIRDAISNGWFAKKFETLVIRTDKGTVTIEGVVESFDDQRKLNDEIRKVEGVRSVNNNVQVKNKAS